MSKETANFKTVLQNNGFAEFMILSFVGLVSGILFYVLFAGEVVYNPNEQRSFVHTTWSDLVVIPLGLLFGICGGIVMIVVCHMAYAVLVQVQAWRLYRQGWKSAAAELRRYARSPRQWYLGIELDVPSR